ncbi:cellulase family glycosylhydrolase, partial [Priestia megaterium]|uniref:cellulase family glycosylhydrolase n=1 Tax=Priestia megaterium TaxID=1404 RepID=UPI001884ED16
LVINKNEIKKNEIKKTEGLKLSDTIGTNIHQLQWNANFSLMKEYGVNIVRDALVWDIIEKDKGVYDFVDNGKINYDDFITRMKKNKIRPFLMLLYTNHLYTSNKSLDNEQVKQAYSMWAAAAAARYKNNNIIWEIYNEPNIDTFWMPQTNSAYNYTDVVKRTAPLIKKKDPSGIVVAPALAGSGDISLQWLEETFRQGILEYVDAVSIHPYRTSNPESVIEDYKKLRILISKYTDKKIPIISGEWGYSNVPNWNNQGATSIVSSELKQAQFNTRMLLINHSQGIPISIIYDWKDDGYDDKSVEHHFGLLSYDQITPKPSGVAFKTLTGTLSRYKFVKRIRIGNDNDYLFKYVNDELKTAYAYWTTDNEHTFVLRNNVKGEIVTMLGQKSKVYGNNLTLSISNSPSYLIVD